TQSLSNNAVRSWFALRLDWPLFLVVFLAAVVVAHTMEDRPVASLGLSFHSRWQWQLAQGMAWGVGLASGVMLLLVCLGAYRIHGFQEGLVSALEWGLAIAVTCLGVGLFEEFLHRGYLLQNLIDGLGLPVATAISCLLFAALHLPNRGETP